MSKLIRILVVWLCMLSLPLQGLAAATMAPGDSVHQHRMARHLASLIVSLMADIEPGITQADETPCHGSDHARPSSSLHASADKCSACASCCASVAMVAPVLQWRAPSQEPAVLVVQPNVGRPSFHPEGLDRPPRSSSA